MIPALTPVFSPSYLFTFLYLLHTSYLNINALLRNFGVNWVKSLLIQLFGSVCQPCGT